MPPVADALRRAIFLVAGTGGAQLVDRLQVARQIGPQLGRQAR